MARAIATVILLIAIFVMLSAERRACTVVERLRPHDIRTFKMVNLRLVSWAISAATLALIAALWRALAARGPLIRPARPAS